MNQHDSPHVHLNLSAPMALVSGTQTPIVFPAGEVYDTNYDWDAANSQYVAEVPGYYLITANAKFTSATEARLLVMKNGAIQAAPGTTRATAGLLNFSLAHMAKLDVGDIITFEAVATGTSPALDDNNTDFDITFMRA